MKDQTFFFDALVKKSETNFFSFATKNLPLTAKV